MSDAPLLFLDANALASPVTRTLLIAGANADGLRWTWSAYVEAEADEHARGQAMLTSEGALATGGSRVGCRRHLRVAGARWNAEGGAASD